MKRLARLLSATVLVLAGGGGAAAVAAPPQPPPGLPLYLALGDSVANGQNSAAPSDLDAYWAQVALWRQNGYVTPLRTYLKGALNCLPAASPNAADGCRQLQLTNLARSAVPPSGSNPGLNGVTTRSLITEQLPVAEATLTARNRDANPRNDVEVVTLTVGGNEIFDAFLTQDPAQIQAALTTFTGNYHEILARLRAAAGPQMPIITMTYFNPLPYCGYAAFGDAANYVLEALPTPYGNGLNGIIRTLSVAHGAVPAEVFGSLGAGDFFDCKHPNTSGYAKITTAFETAWRTASESNG